MFSGFRCYPAQILQHDLIENAFPDVMGCAGFAILFVSTADEVVVVGGHCMRPLEHHCFATIGTNYQSGILVLLIHLCGAAFVFPYPLYNIPNLFCDDGRMRIFKHEAFFPWVFNFAFVLITVVKTDKSCCSDLSIAVMQAVKSSRLPVLVQVSIIFIDAEDFSEDAA